MTQQLPPKPTVEGMPQVQDRRTLPPPPHFRNRSHSVASDVNIESEHRVLAKYTFPDSKQDVV